MEEGKNLLPAQPENIPADLSTATAPAAEDARAQEKILSEPEQTKHSPTPESEIPSIETITPPKATEMEVHHHTHPGHDNKTWADYGWEFLMLFLAVFCGFLAEYFLEHKIEDEREKKYIKSLVEDLKQDTISFSKNINDFHVVLEKDDSLILLLNRPDVKNYGAALYYMGRISSRNYPIIVNDATIQQLKNSGGFRLISNEDVAKKIVEYYNRLVFINHLQDVELLQGQDYRLLAIDVFDAMIFNSMINPQDNSVFRPSGNPSLLTYNVQVLKRLSGLVSYHKNSQLGLSQSQTNMKKAAAELILFIKKEYHLKDE